MFFKRYYLGCLAHASYLIADEETGTAAVVDPQRDIQQYVDDAQQHGFQIRYVFLTHFHADFVAGHIELRDQLGASIYLSERAQAEYAFRAVKDGDVVEVGNVRFAVLETPGHTPEGISLLLFDLTKSDRQPHAVLTGDTLFIGDVGRPDLLASIGVSEDELADMLYDSLHHKLLDLPDETLVYPAHGAGSMCGKNLSNAASSTIGEQRKYNYALQPMTKEAFKRLVTANQPQAPDYFAHDAMMNRRDRSSLDGSLQKSLKALPLDDVLAHITSGTQLVDVRDPAVFAGAHLAGSINIPLDGKYATWAGTILDPHTPIVIIAEKGQEEEAIMRLGRIGFDQVAGYLQDGVAALDHHSDLVKQVGRMTATTLHEQIVGGDPPTVIDVRTAQEWESGHIEGSINIPLNQLQERVDEVPAKQMVVVHCQGGYRSSIAASLLQRAGRRNIVDMVGGFNAWNSSRLPVAQIESSAAY